ncbi:right-handed parallel beta-helix repeat-containing protein [Dyella nitratireducens]|uniref:Right handed beta helix domain-containing protein n=1 Tax=Dyella nitratireducens TaxID=1849580 RepID=A0ABQ1GFP3_9GAMM|nr:right-handed parallel beta-helix repeat-containing protein [Dyella nitratireducens]GGA42750.1 hypothetical protein GCM10010981_34810 [Dyella nitratireducens]GLQ41962.1 hypothetical protein GCM10007902_18120 [Dyella nitratireducens]
MMHNIALPRTSTLRRGPLRISLLALPLIALYAWSPFGYAKTQQNTGSTVISVRDKGAKGDGVHDDTAAFQSAIDNLPSSGGTVTVPSGNYVIDAMRAINLRSNMVFQMAPDATLTAIANSSPRSHVIKVWNVSNVTITGGRIVGEREGHTGIGGEWGYGINIESSHHVRVSNMHLSGCWGDGMWIGALGPNGHAKPSTDVVVDNIVSTGNRRQGLSIGPVDGVTITNSTFSNSHGTKPEAGIDIEPQEQGPASNITIDHCTVTGNHGTGMEIHDYVSHVTVKNSSFTGNNGYGLLTVDGATQVTVVNNTMTDNGLVGLAILGRSNQVQATNNTLGNNSTRYPLQQNSALARSSSFMQSRQMQVDTTTREITTSGNTYSQ